VHRRPRRRDCVSSQVVNLRLVRTTAVRITPHGATATLVVVVLGSNTTDAFRIRMGRSRARRFRIATGVVERKRQPGRIARAKARTKLGSRGDSPIVFTLIFADWTNTINCRIRRFGSAERDPCRDRHRCTYRDIAYDSSPRRGMEELRCPPPSSTFAAQLHNA